MNANKIRELYYYREIIKLLPSISQNNVLSILMHSSTWLKLVLLALVVFSFSLSVQAQYKVEEFSLGSDVSAWYDSLIGRENTGLQLGEFFEFERKAIGTHPYYQTAKWSKADITYRNQTFTSAHAMYNLEHDVLIVQNGIQPTYNLFPLQLNKEQVSSFSIANAQFKFIAEPVGLNPPGYYKFIFEGSKITLISKLKKDLKISSSEITYDEQIKYYLRFGDDYQHIKTFQSILKHFPEYKKDIRKERKKIGLNRINDPSTEYKLGQLIEYCDQLRP